MTAPGPTGQSGRYLQYRAELGTTDTERTPLLRQVTIGYNDNEAPTILTPHSGPWRDGRSAGRRRWSCSSARRWTRRRSRRRRSGCGLRGLTGRVASDAPGERGHGDADSERAPELPDELHGDGGGDGRRRRGEPSGADDTWTLHDRGPGPHGAGDLEPVGPSWCWAARRRRWSGRPTSLRGRSVEYGTSVSLGTSTPLDPTLVTAHSVALSGLSANTTYYYRVTSADASGNATTSGIQSFLTPLASYTDTTVADFSAGTLDTGVAVQQSEDGEVALAAASGLDGVRSLPCELDERRVGGGRQRGGRVGGSSWWTARGRTRSRRSRTAPGTSVEFRATFTAGQFQTRGPRGRGRHDGPSGMFTRGAVGHVRHGATRRRSSTRGWLRETRPSTPTSTRATRST